MVWIGSNMGVQVWDPDTKSIRAWFQLDIDFVSGFTTYQEIVYGAVKNNGEWGIMEFIHANYKVYYRDFYGRSDIQIIDKIAANKILFGIFLFIIQALMRLFLLKSSSHFQSQNLFDFALSVFYLIYLIFYLAIFFYLAFFHS